MKNAWLGGTHQPDAVTLDAACSAFEAVEESSVLISSVLRIIFVGRCLSHFGTFEGWSQISFFSWSS